MIFRDDHRPRILLAAAATTETETLDAVGGDADHRIEGLALKMATSAAPIVRLWLSQTTGCLTVTLMLLVTVAPLEPFAVYASS